MFTELMPLRAGRTVLITMARENDTTLRATVVLNWFHRVQQLVFELRPPSPLGPAHSRALDHGPSSACRFPRFTPVQSVNGRCPLSRSRIWVLMLSHHAPAGSPSRREI